MSKSKHYTSIEKKLFLEILKDFKHIIEIKKSDSSTLEDKELAWNQICKRYNDSTMVMHERTVQQLKKLWTNLKQTQREALTKEKQARLATGGGPPPSPVNIDPDVAIIAPHLLETAPVLFTSNMTANEMNEKGEQVLDFAVSGDIATLYESNDESYDKEVDKMQDIIIMEEMYDKENKDTNFSKEAFLPKEHEKSNFVCTQPVKMTKGKKNTKEYFVREEDGVKVKRLKQIMEQEKDISEIKKLHEKNIATMKEDFQKELHALQIREATAKAELAELRLKEEKKKMCF